MSEKIISIIAKVIIWVCLAVVIFSPLYLNSQVFFPFIVTKTIAFNIAVEVMFLAFLVLSLTRKKEGADEKYRLKINLVIILFGLYIIWSFITSLIGDSFYRSFWSNNERSEGLLLFLHLFLLLWVVTSFFRRLKDWMVVFDLSFIAGLLVSIVGLGQFLHLPWLFASSGGTRLAGTLGNAGYMAGYLIFSILIGLFLVFRRKNKYIKAYYLAAMILQGFIVFNTLTRGGILALFLVILIFIFYLLLFYLKNKWFKISGWAVIVLMVALVVTINIGRESDFVASRPTLSRFTLVSLSSTTVQNRFITWDIAIDGFKEKPFFGWGQENFYQSFDKYFNPDIYRHAGSVVWFDRAHNVIFDRLLTGGILGLLLYLSFLFVPFFYLWRHYKRRGPPGEKESTLGKVYLVPTIFTLIILAYFIQNLFIFEALVIYIPLFLIVAFASLFGPHYRWRFMAGHKFKVGLLVVFAVAFIPILYSVNIKPLSANLSLTQAINKPEITVQQRLSLFKRALLAKTYGNQEYRRQLFSFLERVVNEIGSDQAMQPFVMETVKFTGDEMQKQLDENPYSAANYLLVMRFNNFMFNYTGQVSYIDKSLELFERAKELAPNRQQVYFEGGYAYLFMANFLKRSGQASEADTYYDLAIPIFQEAVELNSKNLESHAQLANVFIFAGRNQALMDLLVRVDEKESIRYSRAGFLSKIINTAVSAKNYEVVKLTAKLLIADDSSNVMYYTQLALAHAFLGEDDEAIAIAEMIAEAGGDARVQSDDFIKKVRAGEFRQ